MSNAVFLRTLPVQVSSLTREYFSFSLRPQSLDITCTLRALRRARTELARVFSPAIYIALLFMGQLASAAIGANACYQRAHTPARRVCAVSGQTAPGASPLDEVQQGSGGSSSSRNGTSVQCRARIDTRKLRHGSGCNSDWRHRSTLARTLLPHGLGSRLPVRMRGEY